MISLLAEILGFAMRLCYGLLQNYGLAIILFVFISKIILLPISIWVHKNGIKLVKIQPDINFLKVEHYGDYDYIAEEQSKIFKKAGYSPIASLIPLAIQIILLMGIVEVIYNPLTYILRLPNDVISSLVSLTGELTGADTSSNSIQLLVLSIVKANPNDFSVLGESFLSIQSILNSIFNVDMSFLGLDLSWIPSQVKGITLVVPFITAFSSWLQCFTQNKSSVLQSEQGKLNKYITMVFSVGLSLYLGWFVPVGVALYWIISTLLSIVQMYTLNYAINPKKYIDYEKLKESKKALEEIEGLDKRKEKWYKKDPNKKREKADYKRFFSIANKHLVFYSEKSGYYKYFESIIEELLRRSNIIIHYITSDPDDQIFKIANEQPRIKPYYIGEKRLIMLMMKMDADIVVMTMPDLENYHIKRSYVKKDVEYIYVFHGVGSVHMVLRKGALDHYDTILCVGPHQIEEIREIEKIYKLPKKNLVPCGYGVIEKQSKAFINMPVNELKRPQILIAPSWQKDNIMESCLDEILRRLIALPYDIILRPHPQYLRHKGENLERIKHNYEEYIDKNLFIQEDFANSTSIYQSDILITDWSTIAYEYSYVTLKPVVFINTPMKVMNPEYTKISLVPLDISLRNEIGVSLDIDNLDELVTIIKDISAQKKEYKEKIEKILNKYVYNFGSSGEVGAKYIIKSLMEKKHVNRMQ